MRRQLQDKQPVLLVMTILALSSGASAFAPALHHLANHPVRGDLTRRFVGNPWPLPHTNDTIKSAIPLRGIVPVPAVRTPSVLASSLLLKDASKEPTSRDLVQQLDRDSDAIANNPLVPIAGVLAAAILLAVGASVSGVLPALDTTAVGQFFQDPTAVLEQVAELVTSMGPAGPLYFSLAYILAEVLCIPAVPLTATAGYLFGVGTGTLVVLLSASTAASISFVIGRTLLRTTVEQWMQDTPRFAKLDKAIGKEGFKLMFLLRLSPLFPFALSNYLYGATSIDFASFFWATLLGFAPGTLAYVYTGVVGKALTAGGDSAQPWFVYAGGAVLVGGLVKLLVDVASSIVAEIEEDAEGEA